MRQKPMDAASDRSSNLRKVQSEAVDQIRSHDFTLYSDRDLTHTLDTLKTQAGHDSSDEALPFVFAVVAESINRRLGAWQIFAPSVNEPRLKMYHDIAAHVLQSGIRETRDLDDDEQTIVKTIVHVYEKSKTKYPSTILLPADFYQALARKDTGDVAAFRPTDEQLLAGILLYKGSVVELDSGEGKTIAAAFPAVLHAMSGNAVHIITANDYLAARDYQLLAPIYESLGLTADVVVSYLGDEERRDAYTKQIVYGTLREFGFDFLRDNLKRSPEEQVQRKREVAIVDEVDHALIDEAGIPMIIGGAPKGTKRSIARVRDTVRALITQQTKVVHSLEGQLVGADGKPAELNQLLAKLLLAQPESHILRRRFIDNPQSYKKALALIDQDESDYPDSVLTPGLFYSIDPQNRFVTLTEEGQDFLETHLGQFFDAETIEQAIASVAKSKHMSLAERRKATARLARQLCRQYNLGNQVYQMLRGRLLLKKDVDYLVTEDSIVLIDRFTGRPRPDSRYQQGLQAALEAKEDVTVHSEFEVRAQISVQGFISQYEKVSGMTGTALTSRDELHQMYRLDVQVIPPTQPSMRVDLGHRVYAARRDKLSAVADEVQFFRQVGRPVLVATLTIEQSEEVSRVLTERGVPHNVLNAVSCHDEARIVKEAGNFGAVTVATNMAGRGTDIILAPDLYALIADRYGDLVQQFLSRGFRSISINCHTKGEAEILRRELSGRGTFSVTQEKGNNLEKLLVTSSATGSRVDKSISLEFGMGLHVIGTELNQSARIDLQLIGRCGRQGEFGSSRFFLSLEDQLYVNLTAGSQFPPVTKKVDPAGRVYFEGKEVDQHLEQVQQTIEREAEAQRHVIQEHGGVLDSQTLFYYRARREVMECSSFRDYCVRFAREKARNVVAQYFPGDIIADYSLRFEGMVEELQEDYRIDCSNLRGCDLDQLIEGIGDLLVANLVQTEARFGPEAFTELAKLLFLRTSDELWREHRPELQELMFSILRGARGHNAALSEYVLQASKEQKSFRQRVIGLFLSRLVSFPIADIPARPMVDGLLLETDLAHDAALVLV